MFYWNDLIKIYLMVLAIVFTLHYCELKETTVLRKLIPYNQMKDETNHLEKRAYTNYKRNIRFGKKKPKRRHLILHDLKNGYDEEIKQLNLQILKDQTKTNLLKLQNSYFNFYRNEPKNKYQQSISKENSVEQTNKNSKNKLRKRNNLPSFRSGGKRDNLECGKINGKESTPKCDKPAVVDMGEVLSDTQKNIDKLKTIIGQTCALNGTWISDKFKMGFNITFSGNSPEAPKDVHLAISEDPQNHDKVLNCSWNITARIPFSSHTMLIITAEHAPDNSIAVFIGQCQHCDKTDLVIGQWMMQKYANDSSKVEDINHVYGDVLRRQA